MNGWVSVLIVNLVRNPDAIMRALDKVEPSDIAVMSDATTAQVWHASREYFKKHRRPISRMSLIATMSDYLQSSYQQDVEVEELGRFINWMYNEVTEAELETGEACAYMERLLQTSRVELVAQAGLAEGRAITELFDEMASGMRSASVGDSVAINVLSDYSKILNGTSRMPVGGNDVSYFNKLLSGGVIPGEEYVLIGPTGGFKTTMAIDIVCSMALLGQQSIYLSYEQTSNAPDIPARFISRFTGIPKTTLTTQSELVKLTPADYAKIDEAAKKYANRVLFYDCTTKTHRPSDILGLIRDAKSDGADPKLVVIDQLLTVVNRLPEVESNPENVRRVALKFAQDLKTQVAEQVGVPILVLHQMTAGLANNNPYYKPKLNDSAEVKGIGMWVDFVINLGNAASDTRCMWALTTKARGGNPVEMILQGDGATSRMRPATWMQEHPSQPGKFIEVGTENKLPTPGVRSGGAAALRPGI